MIKDVINLLSQLSIEETIRVLRKKPEYLEYIKIEKSAKEIFEKVLTPKKEYSGSSGWRYLFFHTQYNHTKASTTEKIIKENSWIILAAAIDFLESLKKDYKSKYDSDSNNAIAELIVSFGNADSEICEKFLTFMKELDSDFFQIFYEKDISYTMKHTLVSPRSDGLFIQENGK